MCTWATLGLVFMKNHLLIHGFFFSSLNLPLFYPEDVLFLGLSQMAQLCLVTLNLL